eukprot:TRINITY_DN1353_c0_g1_i6.p1 TRINITY_DN1353_c0_g1~~TRINITY_DN1353_c0_g1_i6.p1  ORF type:complete len:785 (-),score=210.01 TRINITY_DN1353_c0_g1_i6:348-2702(-)
MSDWGFIEIEDAVWSGYGETTDHTVPEHKVAEDNCMVKVEHKNLHGKVGAVAEGVVKIPAKEENAIQMEGQAMEHSSNKENISTDLLDIDPWTSLQDDKDSNAFNSNNFSETNIKLEKTEVPDIYTSEGDLEFFGNANDDRNNCGLLDYGWPNIGIFEDVERLLRNCEPPFGQASCNAVDELLWPSSGSVDILQASCQNGLSSLNSDSKVLKGKLQEDDPNMEFVPCDNPVSVSCNEGNSKPQTHEVNSNFEDSLQLGSSLDIKKSQNQWAFETKPALNGQQFDDKVTSLGKPSSRLEPGIIFSDKANSSKRQLTSQKHTEDKGKGHLLDIKGAPSTSSGSSCSTGNNVQHSKIVSLHNSASSALQVFPSPAHSSEQHVEETSLRQTYPQVPYVHAGYGYPMHYVPFLPSLPNYHPQLGQPQSMFTAYQPPTDMKNQQQNTKKLRESSPVRPLTMTPQEKIEKLRWRQQMQARLAIEQQQQKLGSHNDSGDASLINTELFKNQTSSVSLNEGASNILRSPSQESESLSAQEKSTVSAVTSDDINGFMEESVLKQLQNVISQLDLNTRRCIKDALYRLARSAMQRRLDESKKNQNETCMANEMETNTNPIDRTIAYLLFNKCSVHSAESSAVREDFNSPCVSLSHPFFCTKENPPLLQTSTPSSAGISMISMATTQYPVPAQSPSKSQAFRQRTTDNPIHMNDSPLDASCSPSPASHDQPCNQSVSEKYKNSDNSCQLRQTSPLETDTSTCPPPARDSDSPNHVTKFRPTSENSEQGPSKKQKIS